MSSGTRRKRVHHTEKDEVATGHVAVAGRLRMHEEALAVIIAQNELYARDLRTSDQQRRLLAGPSGSLSRALRSFYSQEELLGNQVEHEALRLESLTRDLRFAKAHVLGQKALFRKIDGRRGHNFQSVRRRVKNLTARLDLLLAHVNHSVRKGEGKRDDVHSVVLARIAADATLSSTEKSLSEAEHALSVQKHKIHRLEEERDRLSRKLDELERLSIAEKLAFDHRVAGSRDRHLATLNAHRRGDRIDLAELEEEERAIFDAEEEERVAVEKEAEDELHHHSGSEDGDEEEMRESGVASSGLFESEKKRGRRRRRGSMESVVSHAAEALSSAMGEREEEEGDGSGSAVASTIHTRVDLGDLTLEEEFRMRSDAKLLREQNEVQRRRNLVDATKVKRRMQVLGRLRTALGASSTDEIIQIYNDSEHKLERMQRQVAESELEMSKEEGEVAVLQRAVERAERETGSVKDATPQLTALLRANLRERRQLVRRTKRVEKEREVLAGIISRLLTKVGSESQTRHIQGLSERLWVLGKLIRDLVNLEESSSVPTTLSPSALSSTSTLTLGLHSPLRIRKRHTEKRRIISFDPTVITTNFSRSPRTAAGTSSISQHEGTMESVRPLTRTELERDSVAELLSVPTSFEST